MAAGIIVPSLFSLATSTSETLIFGRKKNTGVTLATNGPWTPPQYSQPSLTILTVPASSSSSTGQPASSSVSYVFDAVFRVLHKRTIKKTSHPVLTGANISDHAYVEPSRVTLEIGMSDAMASFSNGIWVGASTKSISAWQILKGLANNFTLMTLTTRLDTYQRMMIIDLGSPDENKTKHGLRSTIVLEELLSASVISTPASSARPQTTNATPGGTIQSSSPNLSQTEQYSIPSPLYPNVPTYPTVPGAGDVSSNSLSQVSGPQ